MTKYIRTITTLAAALAIVLGAAFACDDDAETGTIAVICGEGPGTGILVDTVIDDVVSPCTGTVSPRPNPTIPCEVCEWRLHNGKATTMTTTGISRVPDTIVSTSDTAANPEMIGVAKFEVDCEFPATEVGTFEVTVRDGFGNYVCDTEFAYDVTVVVP